MLTPLRSEPTLSPAQRNAAAVTAAEGRIAQEVGGSWEVKRVRSEPLLADTVQRVTGHGVTRVVMNNKGRRFLERFKADAATRYDVLVTREGKGLVLTARPYALPYRIVHAVVSKLPRFLVAAGKSKGVRGGLTTGVLSVSFVRSIGAVIVTTVVGGVTGAKADSDDRRLRARANDLAVGEAAERIYKAEEPVEFYEAYGIYLSELASKLDDLTGAKPIDEGKFAAALRAEGL